MMTLWSSPPRLSAPDERHFGVFSLSGCSWSQEQARLHTRLRTPQRFTQVNTGFPIHLLLEPFENSLNIRHCRVLADHRVNNGVLSDVAFSICAVEDSHPCRLEGPPLLVCLRRFLGDGKFL
ncbi:hypothetical protein VTJ04DRAFT_10713 [Mycothermus thermophilus]|uniref:uncharacterized protein n=1 Tax=Humicola insolens TaxID=85995 RepID=UPI00374263B4